jgi:hypothetical protein
VVCFPERMGTCFSCTLNNHSGYWVLLVSFLPKRKVLSVEICQFYFCAFFLLEGLTYNLHGGFFMAHLNTLERCRALYCLFVV